jgi:hypothetical protein
VDVETSTLYTSVYIYCRERRFVEIKITFSSEDGLFTNAEKCPIQIYIVIKQKSLLMDGLSPLLYENNQLFLLKEKLYEYFVSWELGF